MIDIFKNIEAIRKEKGITQSEIGKRLGVKQTAYSNYVTRNLDMPFSRLSLIADALGVQVIDIITYPDRYVPETQAHPTCEECEKKQRTIDNLNLLITVYQNKLEKYEKSK